MRFVKDILLFDTETTGEDTDKDQIIQLSAVLLDKDNLLEKATFNSYVKTSLLENTLHHQATVLGIPVDLLKKSPKILDVAHSFSKDFAEAQALMSAYSLKQFLFLRALYKRAGVLFPFDYRLLDQGSLHVVAGVKMGYKKLPTLFTMFEHFKLKVKNPHNSLERARSLAEVFRKLTTLL